MGQMVDKFGQVTTHWPGLPGFAGWWKKRFFIEKPGWQNICQQK